MIRKDPSFKLYKDPVHGDIVLNDLHIQLIDTPEFQRLDGIKQLGFAYCAYRGAKHTRFLHSIGTCYVTQRMLLQIFANHKRFGQECPFPFEELSRRYGETPEEKRDCLLAIVSTAALLHDTTHIPFGHTLEDEFTKLYKKHDSLLSFRLYNLLSDPRSGLYKVFAEGNFNVPCLNMNMSRNHFSPDEIRKLVRLIICFKERFDDDGIRTDFGELTEDAKQQCEKSNVLQIDYLDELKRDYLDFRRQKLFHPFMSDVVSNTICADLLDYVPRDLHGTGIQGAYDRRLWHYFFIGKDIESDTHRLCIRIRSRKSGMQKLDIVSSVMDLMQLRYALAERVYYHKSKVAASTMLVVAMRLAGKPQDSTPYDDEENSVLHPTMTDEGLLAYVEKKARESSANTAKKLIGWIRARRLYKPFLVIPYSTPRGGEEINVLSLIDFYLGEKGADHLKSTEEKLNAAVEQFLPYVDKSIYNGKVSEIMSAPKEGHRPWVVIYCPRPKLQAKEVNARVEFQKGRSMRLGQHAIFKERAGQLNEKYRLLWKFFVLIHPDLIKDTLLVSKVISRFLEVHNFSSLPHHVVAEMSPYGFLPKLEQDARFEIRKMESRSEALHPVITETSHTVSTEYHFVDFLQLDHKNGTNLLKRTIMQKSAYLYSEDYLRDRSSELRKAKQKEFFDKKGERDFLQSFILDNWAEFNRLFTQEYQKQSSRSIDSQKEAYFRVFDLILNKQGE